MCDQTTAFVDNKYKTENVDIQPQNTSRLSQVFFNRLFSFTFVPYTLYQHFSLTFICFVIKLRSKTYGLRSRDAEKKQGGIKW